MKNEHDFKIATFGTKRIDGKIVPCILVNDLYNQYISTSRTGGLKFDFGKNSKHCSF